MNKKLYFKGFDMSFLPPFIFLYLHLFVYFLSPEEVEGVFSRYINCYRCDFGFPNCDDADENLGTSNYIPNRIKEGRIFQNEIYGNQTLTLCSARTTWCTKIKLLNGQVRRDCLTSHPPNLPYSSCTNIIQTIGNKDYDAIFCSCNDFDLCNKGITPTISALIIFCILLICI